MEGKGAFFLSEAADFLSSCSQREILLFFFLTASLSYLLSLSVRGLLFVFFVLMCECICVQRCVRFSLCAYLSVRACM